MLRIPAENLVGDENEGWSLAKVTLGNERVSLSSGGALWGLGPTADDLLDVIRSARRRRRPEHPPTRRAAPHRIRAVEPHPAAHRSPPPSRARPRARKRACARCSPTSTGNTSWAWPRTWPGRSGMLADGGPFGGRPRPLALRLPVQPGAHHRRRHRRRAAQHHRRAGARSSSRHRRRSRPDLARRPTRSQSISMPTQPSHGEQSGHHAAGVQAARQRSSPRSTCRACRPVRPGGALRRRRHLDPLSRVVRERRESQLPRRDLADGARRLGQEGVRRTSSGAAEPDGPAQGPPRRGTIRGNSMKIAMQLDYSGGFKASADAGRASTRRPGLDIVWVAEAYGFDAPSFMGYLAARHRTGRDRRRHPARSTRARRRCSP